MPLMRQDITTQNHTPPSAITLQRPGFAVSLIACIVLVAVMAFLRLSVWAGHLFPVAYGMPLIICVLFRDKRLLWGMAVAFATITFIKFIQLGPMPHGRVDLTLVLLDTFFIAAGIHLLIAYREHIERANADLTAVNAELSTREEEISRQNEELQSQKEELERQGEELRIVNDELARRERALQRCSSFHGRSWRA